MSAWELGNKISEISYRIDGVAGIAELVAERLTDNAESGACWHIAEVLREYGEKLDALASDVVALGREVPTKKKKKDVDTDGRC